MLSLLRGHKGRLKYNDTEQYPKVAENAIEKYKNLPSSELQNKRREYSENIKP